MDLSSSVYYQNFKQNRLQAITPCLCSSTGELHYKAKTESTKKHTNRYLPSPYTEKAYKEDALLIKPQVLPLRKICVDFVVKNFHLVDSLEGFPELIGKELFESCVDIGYFQPDKDGNWLHLMQIFTRTYQDLLLESISLSGKPLFLSSHVDHFLPYRYVKFVDFSNCKIGDDHEALRYLGSLQHLVKLYLHNNCLSVDGIKLLTQSRRRNCEGLEKLEVLRLDGNPRIDQGIFLYLSILNTLALVIVSESVKVQSEKDATGSKQPCLFARCPRSIRFHQKHWENSTRDSLGEGWAIPLISSYISEMENVLLKRQQKANTSRGEASFYTKKKAICLKTVITSPTTKNHLVLCKCVHKSKPSSLPLKRKREAELEEHIVQTKRKPYNTIENTKVTQPKITIDQNLLDLYS